MTLTIIFRIRGRLSPPGAHTYGVKSLHLNPKRCTRGVCQCLRWRYARRRPPLERVGSQCAPTRRAVGEPATRPYTSCTEEAWDRRLRRTRRCTRSPRTPPRASRRASAGRCVRLAWRVACPSAASRPTAASSRAAGRSRAAPRGRAPHGQPDDVGLLRATHAPPAAQREWAEWRRQRPRRRRGSIDPGAERARPLDRPAARQQHHRARAAAARAHRVRRTACGGKRKLYIRCHDGRPGPQATASAPKTPSEEA